MEKMGKMNRIACLCLLLVPAPLLSAANIFEQARRSEEAVGADSINHHAVARSRQAQLPLKGDGVTVYYVAEPALDNDESLWSLSDSTDTFQSTTKRTALPRAGRYINYSPTARRQPVLGSFMSGKKGNKLLSIGQAVPKDLPMEDFNGRFAEYLVFDHNLSGLHRNQVESYLALKYGISLSQELGPRSYLDSRSRLVWDGVKQAAYNKAIAGVGIDKQSGLRQTVSSSTSEPRLLELRASNLQEGTYYVWGNNGGQLRFESKRGQGCRLGRKWMAKLTGANRLTADWALNTYALDALPEQGSTLYLAVDESGSGEFAAATTRFYAGKADSVWRFRNVSVAASAEGMSHFQFVAAGDFFVWMEQEQPSCAKSQGAVHLQLVGGRAPFTLRMAGRTIKTSERVVTIDGLEQAEYTLTATDADGRSWEDSFLLANRDFDLPDWDPVLLKKGYAIDVDASTGKDGYSYQWQAPDGKVQYDPVVQLDQAGIYRLTVCDGDGCQAQREVEVRMRADDLIERFTAAPNPTSDGHVRAILQLVRTCSASVLLSDLNGRVWDVTTLEGQSLYEFPCYLPNQGRWLLTVEAAGETKSLVLIRK